MRSATKTKREREQPERVGEPQPPSSAHAPEERVVDAVSDHRHARRGAHRLHPQAERGGDARERARREVLEVAWQFEWMPAAAEQDAPLPAPPVGDVDHEQPARLEQPACARERVHGARHVLERVLERDERERARLPGLILERSAMHVRSALSRRLHRRLAGVDPVRLPSALREVREQVAVAAADVEHATGRDVGEDVGLATVAAARAPLAKARQRPLQRIATGLAGIPPEVVVLAGVVVRELGFAELRKAHPVVAVSALHHSEGPVAGDEAIFAHDVARAQWPSADRTARARGRVALLSAVQRRLSRRPRHMTRVIVGAMPGVVIARVVVPENRLQRPEHPAGAGRAPCHD